uniref:Ig-like domain-containing protein n=1 Tax=Oryzias melastigma TaxID=30732 RepID=A0A3B3BK84_ORYME
MAPPPPSGVRQVTWQRSFKDESIENLATFSSRFGQEVNAAYQGKVEFTRAALNSTSIRLRSVSWEDESCYICLFNMYPDGSKRKHTCLTVTVSSVNTSTALLQKEEEELHAFSCSATGKPAPSIHWELPPDAAVDNQTETTTSRNSDGTFTSSRSVTLRAPPVWSGMVDCVLNQGTSGERRRRIRSGNLEEITKGLCADYRLAVLQYLLTQASKNISIVVPESIRHFKCFIPLILAAKIRKVNLIS